MTAKEKFSQWKMKGAERAQEPQNTFLHRLTMKVLSGLIIAGITTTLIFIVEVRDSVKQIPSQQKDINYLKKAQDYDSQKFEMILSNDAQRGNIKTSPLRESFREFDDKAMQEYLKKDNN